MAAEHLKTLRHFVYIDMLSHPILQSENSAYVL